MGNGCCKGGSDVADLPVHQRYGDGADEEFQGVPMSGAGPSASAAEEERWLQGVASQRVGEQMMMHLDGTVSMSTGPAVPLLTDDTDGSGDDKRLLKDSMVVHHTVKSALLHNRHDASSCGSLADSKTWAASDIDTIIPSIPPSPVPSHRVLPYARLLSLDTQHASVEVFDDVFSFGRSKSCTYTFPNHMVSHVQFTLHKILGRDGELAVEIEDSMSTNGTFVCGFTSKGVVEGRQPLNHGDHITFQVFQESKPHDPPAAAAAAATPSTAAGATPATPPKKKRRKGFALGYIFQVLLPFLGDSEAAAPVLSASALSASQNNTVGHCAAVGAQATLKRSVASNAANAGSVAGASSALPPIPLTPRAGSHFGRLGGSQSRSGNSENAQNLFQSSMKSGSVAGMNSAAAATAAANAAAAAAASAEDNPETVLSLNSSNGLSTPLEDSVRSSGPSRKEMRNLTMRSVHRVVHALPTTEQAAPPPPNVYRERVRYRLSNCVLGTGANSTVHMGLNKATGELIAVKRIDKPTLKSFRASSPMTSLISERPAADPEVSSMVREIDILSRLNHANIVKYIGAEVGADYLDVLLEFVPGGSIASLIKKFGPLDEAVTRRYLVQILEGLRYLHCNNVVHMDIKPANILVTNDGTCRVTDFGASKKRAAGVTNSALTSGECSMDIAQRVNGELCGTPLYMAPEVAREAVFTPKSDVWSVGCSLLEMSSGHLPWAEKGFDNALSVISFHMKNAMETPKVPPKARLSSLGVDLVSQCFRINAALRPSCAELLSHVYITSANHQDTSFSETGQLPTNVSHHTLNDFESISLPGLSPPPSLNSQSCN